MVAELSPLMKDSSTTVTEDFHSKLVNSGILQTNMNRQGRKLWMLLVTISVLLCVILYSNSIVWSLNSNALPLEDGLTVGGVRKLLEDGESVSDKFKLKRLPQCIIVGARKCGTRALLEFLNLHPDIKAVDHEMHFFDDDEKYSLGLEWYRQNMPLSLPNQITLEKSPRYFITPKVPERIHQMNSSIKLIMLLRNPVTRTISDFTQVYYNKIAKGKMFEKFESLAIDQRTGKVNIGYKAVRISLYYQHVERWLEKFSRDQIHIVDGDELIVDPVSEIRKVENFLGVRNQVTERNLYFNETRGFYCMKQGSKSNCLGATKGRKHPHIEQNVIDKLRDFFEPYNKILFRIINRTFDWNNEYL